MGIFSKKEEIKKAQTSEKKVASSDTKKKVEGTTIQAEYADSFVLVAPHVTERSRSLSGNGQYTFRIVKTATKRQVKDSVEKMYGVHVNKVNILAQRNKKRRRGATIGIKRGYKKAVVGLREGETIDIF